MHGLILASVRHLHFFVEKNNMNVFDCGEKKTARKMAEALLKLTESTSLRGKAVDGVHYFSVYDFLNFLTGHERGDEHARKVFFDLLNKSEHREEIVGNCHDFKFQGPQGPETPCMALCGLQWLLANFGGKTAAQCREIAEIVFTRLKASSSSGDAFRPFLVEEGRRGDVDAASGAPGSAQSKALDALDALESVRLGKRKETDELERTERVAKVCELNIKSVQGFADAMTMLDPDWKDDARLVRRVRDFARDSVLETASSLLRPREPRAPR